MVESFSKMFESHAAVAIPPTALNFFGKSRKHETNNLLKQHANYAKLSFENISLQDHSDYGNPCHI